MRGKLGGLVMRVLTMLLVIGLLVLSVSETKATETSGEAVKAKENIVVTETKPYHEGLLNSSVLFVGTNGFQRHENVRADETWDGFASYGLSFKVHDYIRLGLFGGFELQAEHESGDRFWDIGGDVLFHFAPDKVVDPYIQFKVAYVREAFDVFSGITESGYGIEIEGGAEIKIGKFASIIPSVAYSYVKQDDFLAIDLSTNRFIITPDSASGIHPGLSVAFRFTDNPDSSWRSLWWTPFFAYNFAIEDAFVDSYSIGLRIITPF